jgi:hypothetical protein
LISGECLGGHMPESDGATHEIATPGRLRKAECEPPADGQQQQSDETAPVIAGPIVNIWRQAETWATISRELAHRFSVAPVEVIRRLGGAEFIR